MHKSTLITIFNGIMLLDIILVGRNLMLVLQNVCSCNYFIQRKGYLSFFLDYLLTA